MHLVPRLSGAIVIRPQLAPQSPPRVRREEGKDRAPTAPWRVGCGRLLSAGATRWTRRTAPLAFSSTRAAPSASERPRRRLALRDEDRVEVPLAAILVTLLRLLPVPRSQLSARNSQHFFACGGRRSSGPRPTTKTQLPPLTMRPRFSCPPGDWSRLRSQVLRFSFCRKWPGKNRSTSEKFSWFVAESLGY